MSSEIARLLRLLVQGDKEGKLTTLGVSGESAVPMFAADDTYDESRYTNLALGYRRKALSVYNNSLSGSGEAFYGYSAFDGPSGESFPIPKGAAVNIPVNDDVRIWVSAESGEWADLRIEEIA